MLCLECPQVLLAARSSAGGNLERKPVLFFLDHLYVQKGPLGALHTGGPSAGFLQSCLFSHSSHYLVAMTTFSSLESRVLGKTCG